MPDREKVIEGLRHCLAGTCAECPYEGDDICGTLLKAQALTILEEQGPVEPEVLIDTYICGNCKTRLERQALIGPSVLISENFNYCPACGKKVKWD